MCNTVIPPSNTSGGRADILMQIAQQANLVRKTFQDAPKSTVSNATTAAAAALASMNKKRQADGNSQVAAPSKKQAMLNSRYFHSSIAHLTNRNASTNRCEATQLVAQRTELANVEPSKPLSSFSDGNLNTSEQQVHVTKNDIVCGGSKIIDEFIGNKRFRVWIDLHSKPFSKAPRMEDKLKIARSIVHTIQACVPPGRFLTCTSSGAWIEIGYDKSVQVTMQILTNEVKSRFRTVPVKPTSPPSIAVSKPKTFASMAA